MYIYVLHWQKFPPENILNYLQCACFFLHRVPKLKCSAMNSMQACEHKAAYITCALIASVMPLHLKRLICKRRQDVWWLIAIAIAQHCIVAFPGVSPECNTSNSDSCHSIFKIGARNSQRVTHTTHDTIWCMKQVGFWDQMSYSCPMHTWCVIIAETVGVREIEPVISNWRRVAETKEEVIFSGLDKFRSCPPC